jgi:hypothetical protein
MTKERQDPESTWTAKVMRKRKENRDEKREKEEKS